MDVPPPPAIYDHPYSGSVIELRGTLAEVVHYCHALAGSVSAFRALACAGASGNNCFVVIPSVGGKVTAQLQVQIRRHELAHCNGWPSSHSR